MYCQKCGNQIADDAVFCPKCGNRISGEVIGENTLVKDVTKDNKNVKIVLIILVVVAIVGILVKFIGDIVGKSILSNYKQCPDLEVVATTVGSSYGYFVVKNTGDQVIKDFTLAYVGYDASGNVINVGYGTTYETCDFTTANIMPGSIYGLDKHIYIGNQDVKFMDAAISSVTYMDGNIWNTEGLDAWAKDVSDEFSVDEYKKKIENMKSDAILAENNPYIEIIGSEKYHDNSLSSQDDFDLSVKNIGDKTVKKFSVIVLQYDSNGYAVGVDFGFIVQNAEEATVDPANLDPGEEKGWNWPLFFDADCKTYKTLVYEIEFKDDTTWTNEYSLQWMLYNEDEKVSDTVGTDAGENNTAKNNTAEKNGSESDVLEYMQKGTAASQKVIEAITNEFNIDGTEADNREIVKSVISNLNAAKESYEAAANACEGLDGFEELQEQFRHAVEITPDYSETDRITPENYVDFLSDMANYIKEMSSVFSFVSEFASNRAS